MDTKTTPLFEARYDASGEPHWATVRKSDGQYFGYHYHREFAEQLADMLNELAARESDWARLAIARQVIKEYLMVGGLFNPEFMEHHKVRDLLMDIADIIDGDELSPNGLIGPRLAAIQAATKRAR